MKRRQWTLRYCVQVAARDICRPDACVPQSRTLDQGAVDGVGRSCSGQHHGVGHFELRESSDFSATSYIVTHSRY